MFEDAPKIKEIVQDILDVFTGADGGADYIHFISFMEDMCNRYLDNDDKAAGEILNVVVRFHCLLKVAKSQKEL